MSDFINRHIKKVKALYKKRGLTLAECNHLWIYGNISKEKEKHPRVRECAKCKKFENIIKQ